jgi:hypothetical protein
MIKHGTVLSLYPSQSISPAIPKKCNQDKKLDHANASAKEKDKTKNSST